MSTETENVWSALQQAGLVQGSPPAAGSESIDSPWYIKVLLAISGWLSALCLLVFLLGLGLDAVIFRYVAASLVIGIVMISEAYAFLRLPKNDFVEHVTLAVSLAGQGFVVWAIFESVDSEIGWLVTAAFQLVLALVMPHFVHRVLSSFFAAFCFSNGLDAFGVPYLAGSVVMFAAAWVWLNEFNYPKHMRKLRAIGYGFVLGQIQIKGTALFNFGIIDRDTTAADLSLWVQPWTGEVLAGAVMLYVVWQILKRLGHGPAEPVSMAALSGTIFLMVVSMEAHGMTAGMSIMMLGYAGSNRVLTGLGIISLLFFISSYYYLLSATLLVKSNSLLMVGLILLAVRGLILFFASARQAVRHG